MNTSRLDLLLAMARDYEASDLHIIAGVPPSFRVNGEILLAESDALTEADAEEMALQLLNESQRDKFEREWELCISLRHPVARRVRITFYKRNGHPEMSFRFCGDRIATREELGLPAKIDDMARRPNGLFLITGPTGAGKTTMHSPNVAHALERIIGVSEGSAQRQIVLQLANTLQGLIAQDLLPSADRSKRVLVYEFLTATSAVRNLIRENQLHFLENTIQTGAKEGMTLMDNCLYDLYCRCLISYDTAMSRARHPDRISRKKE